MNTDKTPEPAKGYFEERGKGCLPVLLIPIIIALLRIFN